MMLVIYLISCHNSIIRSCIRIYLSILAVCLEVQVSGKQVEHKHALGIWLKTKSCLEDLIPVTSSIFHMGQRKENLYLRKKSTETPASMHELFACRWRAWTWVRTDGKTGIITRLLVENYRNQIIRESRV